MCNLGIDEEESTGFRMNILRVLLNEEAMQLEPIDEVPRNPGALGNAV